MTFSMFEFLNSLSRSVWMYFWPQVLRSKGLLWKEKSDIRSTAISGKYYNPVSVFLNSLSAAAVSEP